MRWFPPGLMQNICKLADGGFCQQLSESGMDISGAPVRPEQMTGLLDLIAKGTNFRKNGEICFSGYVEGRKKQREILSRKKDWSKLVIPMP